MSLKINNVLNKLITLINRIQYLLNNRAAAITFIRLIHIFLMFIDTFSLIKKKNLGVSPKKWGNICSSIYENIYTQVSELVSTESEL